MYIVSSSSGRKEYDTIHDAMKNASDTDDVYEVDGFGNCTKLSKENITELMQKKPVEEKPNETTQELQSQEHPVQQPQEQSVQPQKKKSNTTFIKWAKLILLGAIALMLAYFIIKLVIPAVNGLMGIFNKVL